MAIQIPNPGTGNGASGDNEFVLWSKVKDNFTDQTNAASRLVGVATGQVPLSEQVFSLANKPLNTEDARALSYDANTMLGVNKSYLVRGNLANFGMDSSLNLYVMVNRNYYGSGTLQEMHPYGQTTRKFYRVESGGSFSNWIEHYTTGNTTKEAGTGYLVASSPVLKVQHDSFEKIHEAEQLDVEVENIKTGVYEITGTTGLREGDGWNLKPPKDVNGNVLCICEASEKDGVITLKTYKKKFDFETVSIVADYEQPTDIPEGATVMLRFNDLPLDDTQTEV